MKNKIIMILVALTLVLGFNINAQTPEDLSFLTNRASLASWALKQVKQIEVGVYSSAAGDPNDGTPVASKNINYSGPVSLSAIAKALNGTVFELQTPIPNSYMNVYVNLYGETPYGMQHLFGGGAGGIPVFDGRNWRLGKEESTPSMYLTGQIFVPYANLVSAWIVTTNQFGWSYKKSLFLTKAGFYFDTADAGEVYICVVVSNENGDGGTKQWVYNVTGSGSGRRQHLPSVIAAVTIRDSQDVRDYGDNATDLSHYVYTYRSEYSSVTYGIVPLQVANYTQQTIARLNVRSDVGSAKKYIVTKIGVPPMTDTNFIIESPSRFFGVEFNFSPGLYHIVPVGIDVSASWWEIEINNGWGIAVGKGI